eukprot:TRINITY_DN52296_c0_g2_i1.p1 TRINITY_DN52296_c0_g2~~TRINITY_DN52296_c0_g2_i1.p1  ORF type:complete len:104 (-),score=36.01 TRINITY_DN52296_c0_g2_i1:27-338(-)
MVDFFFFQAEDGIRDAQESRGLGDVYKRQVGPFGSSQQGDSVLRSCYRRSLDVLRENGLRTVVFCGISTGIYGFCLLYTSDAADEEDSVDLGGRRIIKKKKKE